MSVADRAAHDRQLYLDGLKAFNAGDAYGCHELLEDLWLRNRSPMRPLFQALIQLAAAELHRTRGHARAVARLRTQAAERLAPYAPQALGLDVDALLAGLCAGDSLTLRFTPPCLEAFRPYAGGEPALRVPYAWHEDRAVAST